MVWPGFGLAALCSRATLKSIGETADAQKRQTTRLPRSDGHQKRRDELLMGPRIEAKAPGIHRR